MKKIFVIFLFISSFKVEAQKIAFDENIKVDSTEILLKWDNYNFSAYSSIDNLKSDSLVVRLYSIGLVGYEIHLDFTNNIEPRLYLYSDTNEFNGMHSMEIPLKSYKLTLNKNYFEKDDPLMGFIEGITDYYIGEKRYSMQFSGHFSHIVGKVLRKRRADDTYDYYDLRH